MRPRLRPIDADVRAAVFDVAEVLNGYAEHLGECVLRDARTVTDRFQVDPERYPSAERLESLRRVAILRCQACLVLGAGGQRQYSKKNTWPAPSLEQAQRSSCSEWEALGRFAPLLASHMQGSET